jgi:hypothetical protein
MIAQPQILLLFMHISGQTQVNQRMIRKKVLAGIAKGSDRRHKGLDMLWGPKRFQPSNIKTQQKSNISTKRWAYYI